MKIEALKTGAVKGWQIKHANKAGGVLIAALLAGCASGAPVPVRVEVPVAVPCPAPQPLPRPVLPIADLAPDAPDADVLRAVIASLEALTGYAQALERQLGAYAPASAAK